MDAYRHARRDVERTLLPRRPLGLDGQPDPDEPVLGLELLHSLGRVVHEPEAGRLATTILRPQAEDADLVLGGLVHGRELLAELLLGDVGAVGVEDVTARHSISTSSFGMFFSTAIPQLVPKRGDPFGVCVGYSIRNGRWGLPVSEIASSSVFEKRVANSHDHLLAPKQGVADELARAQRNGGVGVRHLGLSVVGVGDGGEGERRGGDNALCEFQRSASRRSLVRVGGVPNVGLPDTALAPHPPNS